MVEAPEGIFSCKAVQTLPQCQKCGRKSLYTRETGACGSIILSPLDLLLFVAVDIIEMHPLQSALLYGLS